MIELDEIEKKLILLCKNHLNDKYPFTDTWTDTLKPFYNDHYGLTAEKNPKEFKECMFFKLLRTQEKIAENEWHRARETREILAASFGKTFIRCEEEPIERAISMVCGIIQGARYLDENKEPRYSLELKEKQ